MNTSSANISEFTLCGVSASVHRFTREITPAQEGLLDCCSHISALELVDSLNWMLTKVRDERNGRLTNSNHKHLAQVNNIKDWLIDLVDETN